MTNPNIRYAPLSSERRWQMHVDAELKSLREEVINLHWQFRRIADALGEIEGTRAAVERLALRVDVLQEKINVK